MLHGRHPALHACIGWPLSCSPNTLRSHAPLCSPPTLSSPLSPSSHPTRYDPTSNRWLPGPPLQRKRFALGGAAMDGAIYAVSCGGQPTTVSYSSVKAMALFCAPHAAPSSRAPLKVLWTASHCNSSPSLFGSGGRLRWQHIFGLCGAPGPPHRPVRAGCCIVLAACFAGCCKPCNLCDPACRPAQLQAAVGLMVS